jgi:hypothetical protein
VRTLRVLLTAATLSLVACSGEKGVLEERSDRVPSAAGVATDVTFDRIQLDGEGGFEIRDDVESFATRSHHIEPLLGWEGKYVHIGLDDEDRVRWVAGIGLVSGKPAMVTYSGVFESYDEDQNRGTFEDGTVLEFAGTVDPPEEGREVVVEIDVKSDRVVKVLG